MTKKLSVITLVLFFISLFVFYQENSRSGSLVSGSYFIKGLDPNKIHKISLKIDKNKEIAFIRDSGRFTINSHKSYPASTAKVNDLIYKIASIQVKDKIGSKFSTDELRKYGLTKDSRKYLVELFDNQNQKTQSFVVGKMFKNKGHYIVKEGSDEVYLSDRSLWIESSHKDFVDRELLDINKNLVEKVRIHAEESLEIEKKEEGFALVNPIKDVKKEKIDNFVSSLRNTRFDDYFRIDDDAVKKVKFDKLVHIQLKNKVTYDLKVGKDDEKYYLRAMAAASGVPHQFVLSQNAGQKELEGVGDMIEAKTMVDQFNYEKSSWVYQIDEHNYKKLIKNSTDFM